MRNMPIIRWILDVGMCARDEPLHVYIINWWCWWWWSTAASTERWRDWVGGFARKLREPQDGSLEKPEIVLSCAMLWIREQRRNDLYIHRWILWRISYRRIYNSHYHLFFVDDDVAVTSMTKSTTQFLSRIRFVSRLVNFPRTLTFPYVCAW